MLLVQQETFVYGGRVSFSWLKDLRRSVNSGVHTGGGGANISWQLNTLFLFYECQSYLVPLLSEMKKCFSQLVQRFQLGVEQENRVDYIFVFLVSSVLALRVVETAITNFHILTRFL